MANVLVVDDDPSVCRLFERIIQKAGHSVTTAQTLEQGLRILDSGRFETVFLDVRLPDGDGIESISRIQEACPSPEVVIITGKGDPDGAELAIRSGAWDYLQKPFSSMDVLLPLKRSLQYRENSKGSHDPVALRLDGIVGGCRKMAQAYDVLARAAGSEANVLLTGETGTGKELFARAIHENSIRSTGHFVVVDCGALPETLAESTLFGHEKGAFTDASTARTGLFKEADGGTLFLDEIGELPLTVQKKFLRVIQERTFRPIGAQKEVSSNFRLIAATNRDLDRLSGRGGFREDLLHRLRSIVVHLPPLREREGDIKELALHYMKVCCDRYGTGIKGLSPEFTDVVSRYPWPGNVRELSHAMEHAVSMAENEPTLFHVHLPMHIRAAMIREEVETNGGGGTFGDGPGHRAPGPLKDVLENTEKAYLRGLMLVTEWDIQRACSISGLSRSRLYGRLKKYGIQKEG